MSYDRKIDFVCPHLVVEEAIYLSSDRVTVRPIRPISAANSVRVRVNGEVEVPSYGLHTPAEALASKRGPFNIRASVNDTLVIRVDGAPPQTIQIPPGERLSTKEVARRLSVNVPNAVFELTPNGRLRLRTRSTGKPATLMILPSNMASTLGLPVNRQWRGRSPYGGWSLVNDPTTLSDRPTRMIVFDAPLNGFKDYVELNYATLRQECRRCGGLGIENDWRYGVDGNLFEVRDEALLLQEVQKATFTLQGSNPFHTWYGTNLLNTVGRKLSISGVIQTFIVNDVREAFRRWQNIKRQQEEEIGQAVSDAEFPFRLLDVKLTPAQQDPTVLFVAVTIQSRSSTPIILERGVKIPHPADLLGSTAQDGVIRQSLSNFTLTG